MRHGTGTGPAGNFATRQLAEAVSSVMTAVRTALGAYDARLVGYAVVGVAGGSRFDDPAVRARFAERWAQAGLDCPVNIVGDNVVAFAAGTPAPSGHVIVSGTGAIAAEIVDHTLVRMADGLGWLLGDEGSAFWIGRQAARLSVAAYDGQQPMTALARSVASALLGSSSAATAPDARSALVDRVYQREAIALAELAPLVNAHADNGDVEAIEILTEAAERLTVTLERLRPHDVATPIVLAGSCVAGSEVLAAALRHRVAARWDAPVVGAGEGAAGAAWLAATRLCQPSARGLVTLHTRLVRPALGC